MTVSVPAERMSMHCDVEQIPLVTVSYNSPDLIAALLSTFRRFYRNPVYVIDGSTPEIAAAIKPIAEQFDNVRFIPFGYNIHHGPGMAWAIDNLDLSGPVLFLDSDVEILRRGFLESLLDYLEPQMYGVGHISSVNELGQPIGPGGMPYLHPACMLCNIEVMRQWPLPIKHGSPLMPTMIAMAKADAFALVREVEWVTNDFGQDPQRVFIKHDWQGTVIRTGGYHYDMPVASQEFNTTLLSYVPPNAVKVVEVGCHDGAFAKAYRRYNPVCNYTGIERDRAAAELARSHCDFVFNLDIEAADAQCRKQTAGADCWVLGEVLEQMVDPWAVLAAIRATIAPNGAVVVAIRNFQHWGTQVRLSCGDYRYQAGGVLNRPELRQFTRSTMLEMFQQAGFRVTGGAAVIDQEPAREVYLPLIRQMAEASGNNGDIAVQDALPRQFIMVAVPV